MAQPKATTDTTFFAAFARPAWVVMMVAQMLLGLGLAVALILKYYMLVFGTAVCTADDGTLGNMIRCAPTLVLCAHFLIAIAAFRLAGFMFIDRPMALLAPLMLLITGVFLLFLATVGSTAPSWALAAVILALLISVTVTIAAYYWVELRKTTD